MLLPEFENKRQRQVPDPTNDPENAEHRKQIKDNNKICQKARLQNRPEQRSAYFPASIQQTHKHCTKHQIIIIT